MRGRLRFQYASGPTGLYVMLFWDIGGEIRIVSQTADAVRSRPKARGSSDLGRFEDLGASKWEPNVQTMGAA